MIVHIGELIGVYQLHMAIWENYLAVECMKHNSYGPSYGKSCFWLLSSNKKLIIWKILTV